MVKCCVLHCHSATPLWHRTQRWSQSDVDEFTWLGTHFHVHVRQRPLGGTRPTLDVAAGISKIAQTHDAARCSTTWGFPDDALCTVCIHIGKLGMRCGVAIHLGSGHVRARRPIKYTQVSMESFAMHLRQKPWNIPRPSAGLDPKSAVNVTPKQVCPHTRLLAV